MSLSADHEAAMAARPSFPRMVSGAGLLNAARLLWALHLQGRRLEIQAIGVAANIALNLALIPVLRVMGAITAAILTLALMLAPACFAGRLVGIAQFRSIAL